MRNKGLILVAILSILIVTVVTFQPISRKPFRPFDREIDPGKIKRRLELLPYYIKIKTILASVNSLLLLSLFVTYFKVYRETKSNFSLGLLLFSIALLLYSFSSNPIIHWFGGFRGSGLGPFTILTDLFTCIASAILLYLSQQ